ncbi:MAG: glycoside hydrolase family 2 protein, partial [Planctomycetota bacterium]
MPNELSTSAFAISLYLSLAGPPLAAADEDWRPAPCELWTPWAAEVSPARVHPEHPRPTLAREEWLSLNGLWDYAVTPREPDGEAARPPERFEGRILVPFPIEAPLSGVGRRVSPSEHLWYRRAIEAPAGWRSGRILLQFGAVDWEAEVFVDGERLGLHRGGYDAFGFDVTDRLRAPGAHELAVRVWDPTDEGSQPRGKQVRERRGIWYAPSTGIWQTVWLERVPETYIRSLRIVPSLARAEVRVRAEISGAEEGGPERRPGLRVRLRVPSVRLGERAEPLGEIAARGAPGEEIAVHVPDPRAWSPSEPWLYDLEAALEATEDGASVRTIDAVRSYFGLRDVAIAEDASGVARIALNGSFLFQLGLLDQGFWPDGLYTAPADEALRFDIELAKRFGFVMARKHVKVEPERWYAWCDRLGLLVWQDMPSGGGHAPWPRDGAEISRSEDSAAQYRRELEALLRGRGNHPSIVAWVLFNEGWGQFDARGAVAFARGLDPTRLAIAASGGNDVGAGDAHDIH